MITKELVFYFPDDIFYFQYLNKGSLSEPNIDDTRDFKMLDDAMNAVGLSMSDKSNIYRIAAAVLHLGNITFQESTKDKKGDIIELYISSVSSN